MKRKTLLSMATSGLMLAALIPSFAQATDGVVKFSGSISDTTCDINGKAPGEGNETNVELGTIKPTVFDKIGARSPLVPFVLQLSGANCTAGKKVSIEFDQLGNVDPASGNLKLIGSKPATGVQIEVYNDHDTTPQKIVLGQAEASPQIATISTDKAATLKYKAAYVSTEATVGAGSGVSYIRYTLAYQ
ncbi:fimbrial subunit CupB1 [Pseudomonas sp. Eqa60]|jgi:major type 1 subunit fimbrin (pilin)|uniref:Type I pilus biogensis protein FimA n=2 Tax=Pseudomonas TaxID=286 RepID=A0A2C9EI09_PSEPH|nr:MULTISPECIES: fimbrial protein [Pseudomonas]AGL83286.1 type I pilus biogensis protein FimA [Pseudomonas protegens CHA0]MBF0638814.1 type 1 fimbrial protein [Pseudomonas protegens]MBP5110226.1 type 1 fimbrial protein [Pseudomonas protegens]MCD9569179.1 type 1 fimbrial protein [Pseudomonas protegens]MDS9878014.1 fimbrial protein [Pseudomonas protegens]